MWATRLFLLHTMLDVWTQCRVCGCGECPHRRNEGALVVLLAACVHIWQHMSSLTQIMVS